MKIHKKLLIRIGSILACVLLVAGLAFPCFAMISEQNVQNLVYYLELGSLPNDALYYILNTSNMLPEINDVADNVWWYRGVAPHTGDAWSYSYPTSSQSSYNSSVYWCIIWDSVDGDEIDISYGYGTVEYSYSYSASIGTYYSFSFNGSRSGSSAYVTNRYQVIKQPDNTASVTATLDNTIRSNTAGYNIKIGFVSNSAISRQLALLTYNNGALLTTEINVNPQSVQIGSEISDNGYTQEELDQAYSDGFNNGYGDGYGDGESAGFSNSMFRDLWGTVTEAMNNTKLFKFNDIQGNEQWVTLGLVLSAGIGIALFIWILKMFAGG